jgi:hypothetical protein
VCARGEVIDDLGLGLGDRRRHRGSVEQVHTGAARPGELDDVVPRGEAFRDEVAAGEARRAGHQDASAQGAAVRR